MNPFIVLALVQDTLIPLPCRCAAALSTSCLGAASVLNGFAVPAFHDHPDSGKSGSDLGPVLVKKGDEDTAPRFYELPFCWVVLGSSSCSTFGCTWKGSHFPQEERLRVARLMDGCCSYRACNFESAPSSSPVQGIIYTEAEVRARHYFT